MSKPAPKRLMKPLAGAVPIIEMRDRLDRARAALAAVKRAPESASARDLEADLARQIQILERDVAIGR